MGPGTRSKFDGCMFEPEASRKQMYCIEESTCDIVGTFRHPPLWFGDWGFVPPLPPLVTPLATSTGFVFRNTARAFRSTLSPKQKFGDKEQIGSIVPFTWYRARRCYCIKSVQYIKSSVVGVSYCTWIWRQFWLIKCIFCPLTGCF